MSTLHIAPNQFESGLVGLASAQNYFDSLTAYTPFKRAKAFYASLKITYYRFVVLSYFLEAEEKTDDYCKKIESNINIFSFEDLDVYYGDLEVMHNKALNLVEMTEKNKNIFPEAYRRALKLRNKIDDCMQVIYDKAFPPFAGLSVEELKNKREKLSVLLED